MDLFNYTLQIFAIGLTLATILIGIEQYVLNVTRKRRNTLIKKGKVVLESIKPLLESNKLSSSNSDISENINKIKELCDDRKELDIPDFLRSRWIIFGVGKLNVYGFFFIVVCFHFVACLMVGIDVIACLENSPYEPCIKEIWSVPVNLKVYGFCLGVFTLIYDVMVILRYSRKFYKLRKENLNFEKKLRLIEGYSDIYKISLSLQK